MSKEKHATELSNLLSTLSSPFSGSATPVAVILAAGQGKRIKSNRSKMLHKIWGVPTVVRVSRAAEAGLASPDQIIVVGIKAADVVEALAKRPGRRFANQAEQKGTGHAVKIALETLANETIQRDIYVFPGDMGLLDAATVRLFREEFEQSKSHMMVMVGIFEGDQAANYYGRIVRVPEKDASGNPAGADRGKIIRIMEHKDILALDPNTPCTVSFQGRSYSFTREELVNLREYNSGLYAFKGQHLVNLIDKLGYENVQGEMYLTDLIHLFNEAGLSVTGVPALREETLLGFNDKAVLHEMHAIARTQVFEKLNKIISIADKDDFFIADDVVDHLLEIDRAGASLDIAISEGVYLGPGVRLAEGVHIERDAKLEGNIHLGKGVFIGEAVHISTFTHQTMTIGDHTHVLKDNVLKGNITIGRDCLIEAPVRLTGSDEFPLTIGENVRIKGDSYIFGSVIENNCFIVNCILRQTRVACRRNSRGEVIPVSYIFPQPGGGECLQPLDTNQKNPG